MNIYVWIYSGDKERNYFTGNAFKLIKMNGALWWFSSSIWHSLGSKSTLEDHLKHAEKFGIKAIFKYSPASMYEYDEKEYMNPPLPYIPKQRKCHLRKKY